MPNLPNNAVLLYTIRYSQAGQTFLNTAHFKYTDNITGVDDYATYANAILDRFELAANIIADLADLMHPSITIVDHRIQQVHPVRLAPIIHTLGVPGLATGTALPTNTAAVVTKRSEFATRWGIGSWHQPGLPSSALTSAGVMATTWLDDLELALAGPLTVAFVPTAMNGEVNGVLWNITTPLRFTDVNSIQAQSTPRVMRRRTVGLGI